MTHYHRAQVAKKIDTLLLDEQCGLKTLVKKAKTIQSLGTQLYAKLDPSFQGHFQLANINHDVAIITTRSSAWATRLRYHIPVILDILHDQLGQKNIKTIRIKIAAKALDVTRTNRKSPAISSATANFLRQTAESFTDSRLRDSLLKIASHQGSKD